MRPYVEEKLITMQLHPVDALTIYNYSKVAQFQRKWNDTIKMARGLIVDANGVVVARPFPKFFNLEELGPSWNPPSKTITVTTKEDGSLGILYRSSRGLEIATRGSFSSEQAIKATDMFIRAGYTQLPWDTDNYTYLFEIVYPENRIVLDYGKTERLILLGVVDTKTGKDVEIPDWYPYPVKTWEDFTSVDDLQNLKGLALPNAEGFVIRFTNGYRVKVKFEEYVRLHRIMTGVSRKTVWEYLSTGQSIEELVRDVPEEFETWVRMVAKQLVTQFNAELMNITATYGDRPITEDRATYARWAVQMGDYTGYLFSLYDGKSIDAALWKSIKPTADKPFVEGDE